MSDLKPLSPRSGRSLLPPARPTHPPQQQRLMLTALALLLTTLGFLLYHDRDFWFPDSGQADNQTLQSPPSGATTAARPTGQAQAPHRKPRETHVTPAVAAAPAADAPLPPTTITRTILPPLEVEVVAGGVHKTLHPGTNSVRLDLQPDSSSQSVPVAPQAPPDTAASVTANAAERAEISADTTSVVTHSVRPGYPLLARQMKVQGSVILQALIGRDGLIQDLHVVSGPPILATAAEEAVRQWHFKPHYEGSEAVETQAKITVNFTISTN